MEFTIITAGITGTTSMMDVKWVTPLTLNFYRLPRGPTCTLSGILQGFNLKHVISFTCHVMPVIKRRARVVLLIFSQARMWIILLHLKLVSIERILAEDYILPVPDQTENLTLIKATTYYLKRQFSENNKRGHCKKKKQITKKCSKINQLFI